MQGHWTEEGQEKSMGAGTVSVTREEMRPGDGGAGPQRE